MSGEELADDQPDTKELVARIEELEEEHEELKQQQTAVGGLLEELKAGNISRRTFMTGVGLAIGGGAVIGTASAHSASPDWNNTSGTIGEESEPWDRAYVRDLHAESVVTGALVIGGTLYEEDGNSPINETGNNSHTHTMASSADNVVIIPEAEMGFVHDRMQVNGDTGSNYNELSNNDTESTGNSSWNIGHISQYDKFVLRGAGGDRIQLTAHLATSSTGQLVAGQNGNVNAPITQFTIFQDGAETGDLKARVYRRVMNI